MLQDLRLLLLLLLRTLAGDIVLSQQYAFEELLLKTVEEVKPAIHLDNRYRLMRNEPMLDEEGCKTDKIGEDETAPPDMKEAAAKFQYKSPYN